MLLIINAMNIHRGGGGTLLLALLAAINKPAVALLDARLAPFPESDTNLRVIPIQPNMLSRLRGERLLKSLCQQDDTLLCFGNLPPLFANRAKVYVYLQNRYLVSMSSTEGLPWKVKARILIERTWLKLFMRDAKLLVQTDTMARLVQINLSRNCQILPFLPNDISSTSLKLPLPENDYLYVASGEPHKNHKRLIQAWIILAEYKQYPSLRLTLDPKNDEKLCSWIDKMTCEHKLRIVNQSVPPMKIKEVYNHSGALIYPSLFESFGLPLLEAQQAELPIIAGERDYVRDVVEPVTSFDPESAMSIAKAVLRHQNKEKKPDLPGDAIGFLRSLST